jgi:hypothetical protein
MPLLVSCRHCKRPVVMVPRLTEREVVWLWDHLASCDSDALSLDDQVIRPGVENLLRHFRVIEIDGRVGVDRAPSFELRRVLAQELRERGRDGHDDDAREVGLSTILAGDFSAPNLMPILRQKSGCAHFHRS